MNLCEYFNLPPNLLCLPHRYSFYQPNSLVTVINPQAEYYSDICRNWLYESDDKVKYPVAPNDFSYDKVDLICGYLTTNVGLGRHDAYIDYIKKHPLPYTFLNISQPFTDRVTNLAISFKKNYLRLGVDDDRYVYAHWRRGDNKGVYCKVRRWNLHNIPSDTSVNCASDEKPMIQQLKSFVDHNCPLLYDNYYYIATNEGNHDVLKRLSDAGYNYFPPDYLNRLSPMDVFMIELYLGCYSRCTIAFGYSNINFFLDSFREEYKIMKGFHSQDFVTEIEVLAPLVVPDKPWNSSSNEVYKPIKTRSS